MTEATKIESSKVSSDAKRAIADAIAEKTLTHSHCMKDWFFVDGSILRWQAEDFHVLSANWKALCQTIH